MKKLNVPLIIGAAILFLLLLFAFFPQNFTRHDPNFQSMIRTYTEIEDGREVQRMESAPWGTTGENWMGTDEMGRDIYTRLVYGTKTTLTTALLVVALRCLIAIPFGILAGTGSRFFQWLIRGFNTVFTAIPTLFAALFILNMEYFLTLQLERSIYAFAVVLTLLGWGNLAGQTAERARQIMQEEFIEGEVAVGKSKLQIALQNLLPHLIPFLISLVFIEVGLVIFFIAQLSVFQVFVGPRIPFLGMEGGVRWTVAQNPEWGALLSRGVENNRLGRYWMSLYPGIVFAVGIMGFNLTGEGLRIEFEKRTSRVASLLRKTGFVLSPKVYLQQVLRLKEYYRPVLVKTACLVLVAVLLLIPPPESRYLFGTEEALAHVAELIKPEYQGRLSGYEGNRLAGEYIIDTLKSYGLLPYNGTSYTQTVPLFYNPWSGLLGTVGMTEGVVRLISEQNEVDTYQLNQDFIVGVLSEGDLKQGQETGIIYLAGRTVSPEESAEMTKASDQSDRVIIEMVNSYDALNNRLWQGKHSLWPTFVMLSSDQPMPDALPTYHSHATYLLPFGDLAEKLKSGEAYQVEIELEPPALPQEGRNIIAVLPGKNWDQPADSTNRKKLLMIGAAYDGLGTGKNLPSAMRATRAAIGLEIARVLSQLEEPLDSTVVFAFWDGEAGLSSGSRHYNIYDRVFGQQTHQIHYFDVGYAGGGGQLLLAFSNPIISQIDTYGMENSITNRLKEKGIDYRQVFNVWGSYENIGQNLTTKMLLDAADYSLMDTERDLIENLSREQMAQIGQVYLDLITMDPHFQ